MARTGFYPGSFDPVTYGHLDIVARSARLVEKLVLGVGTLAGKKSLLEAKIRVELLEHVTKPIAEHTGVKISVVTFDGLAVDAARRANAGLIIRGLRDASDLTTKSRWADERGLAPDSKPCFWRHRLPRDDCSSLVKQIAQMGVNFLVHPEERRRRWRGA